MKNIIKYILILIILVMTFIILNIYKSKKNIFEDIMIFSLWNNGKVKNEYEITSQTTTSIDVFKTIDNKMYKKIAPGSNGSFVIEFKKPANSSYKINITEKMQKPQNLFFILDGNKYFSMKEMENVIEQKFISTEKITVDWEWKYYVNETQDIQDTRDGQKAQEYIFEIEAIIEE